MNEYKCEPCYRSECYPATPKAWVHYILSNEQWECPKCKQHRKLVIVLKQDEPPVLRKIKKGKQNESERKRTRSV